MTKKICWLFLFLGIILASCSEKISSVPLRSELQPKRKKVFLLAGQSNMEGRADGGELSQADLLRLEQAGKRVTLYYNHQAPVPLQLTIPKKHIQQKFNLEKSFGPEVFFGIDLAENYPEEEFIFIKRSQGGTSLYGCWNPYWSEEQAALMNESNQPKLFADFVQYSKDILAGLDTNDYEICGLLWVQGESDSGMGKGRGRLPSESYGQNLRNLIKETRRQFDVPDLPVLIFQVGSGEVVRGMKETANRDDRVILIPQSNNPNSTNFYPKNPPPVGHYITESMKRIGEQFFKAYQRDFTQP